MNRQELNQLLAEPEGERIEFKPDILNRSEIAEYDQPDSGNDCLSIALRRLREPARRRQSRIERSATLRQMAFARRCESMSATPRQSNSLIHRMIRFTKRARPSVTAHNYARRANGGFRHDQATKTGFATCRIYLHHLFNHPFLPSASAVVRCRHWAATGSENMLIQHKYAPRA